MGKPRSANSKTKKSIKSSKDNPFVVKKSIKKSKSKKKEKVGLELVDKTFNQLQSMSGTKKIVHATSSATHPDTLKPQRTLQSNYTSLEELVNETTRARISLR